MKTFRQLSEATNPMAVHAYPSGKNEFTVHAIGSKVTHVKPGDKLTSSDLDDLTDAGHKVKEVKKPMNEAKIAGWKCDCGCMNNSSSKECKECNTARPMNEDKDDWVNQSVKNDPKYHQDQADKIEKQMRDIVRKGGTIPANNPLKSKLSYHLAQVKKLREMDEEVEQIDEIGDTQRGKHALADYVKSASNDLRNTALQHGSIKKMNKRSTGIQRAVDTLAKEEVENVDEGLGKTLAAGALALGIGAGASASMGNDKPVHYQVQKIGNEYNVYHKNNVGGKVHFSSKNKDDAMKWAMQKEEVDNVEEGKANWDKAHKQGLIDTLHNRMLHKKSMPKMGTLSKAATRELAAKAMAAGKGGKIQEAESGLSTKTLSNYSVKASAATTDKELPMKKTGNRYAGVSKVDKILAMRDKKKVD